MPLLASDLRRGPEARELAERVLISLVHALGSRADRLTVLGGLVPPMLAAGLVPPPPAHLGTTDVDVMLAVHVDSMAPGYATLEETLVELGFEPSREGGWRWLARVEGRVVKVEFLCDLGDQPRDTFILADGCRELGALNLRGTRYVVEDYEVDILEGELIDGRGTVRVQIRRAGLAGYIVAKAFAVMERALQKDYYDLVYALLHNSSGGPLGAARAIVVADFSQNVVAQTHLWHEVGDRYATVARVGPRDFARESLEADPTRDEDRLKEDAVSAVDYFLTELLEVG